MMKNSNVRDDQYIFLAKDKSYEGGGPMQFQTDDGSGLQKEKQKNVVPCSG